MKAVPLAGWLLADLAIVLAIIGMADVSGTTGAAATTTTTSTTTTIVEEPMPTGSTTTTTTAPQGIKPPVEFRMTRIRDRLNAGEGEGIVAEIDERLRQLDARDGRAAIVLVFSKDGSNSDDSQALSEDVIAILEERFPDVMAGAQLRPYITSGEQGDVKIELFLYP